MSSTQWAQAQTYRNIMELLVSDEVDKQLQQLPAKVTSYLNKAELIAYALNRLPPLYATSEKGWQQQCQRAKRELTGKIVAAVRQAIAAVQRDPLRTEAPLKVGDSWKAEVALQELRDLLRRKELSWDNLVDTVEYTLIRTARGEITWRKRRSTMPQNVAWQDYRYL